MLCFSYYAYVFSSTKLEIRTEEILPGSEGRGGWPKQCVHMWINTFLKMLQKMGEVPIDYFRISLFMKEFYNPFGFEA
jgi:hypothetical protein